MTNCSMGENMKKRMGLLLVVMILFLSGINIHAMEKGNTQTVDKYISFFLNEVKGVKNEESLSSLKESLEEFAKNVKPEDAKKILNFISKKIEEGKWDSEKGIKEAIAEGEKEFNVTLTEEQKEKILSVISKIKKLGISPDNLINEAEKIYDKYGQDLKEELEEEKDKIVLETQKKIKEEVSKSASNYFSDMVSNVKSFFKGIFKK